MLVATSHRELFVKWNKSQEKYCRVKSGKKNALKSKESYLKNYGIMPEVSNGIPEQTGIR